MCVTKVIEIDVAALVPFPDYRDSRVLLRAKFHATLNARGLSQAPPALGLGAGSTQRRGWALSRGTWSRHGGGRLKGGRSATMFPTPETQRIFNPQRTP
jgi:hypothetical protein